MNHDKLKRYGSNFLFYSVLCAAVFFVLVPIIFIILSSFKNETKIFSEPRAMPETFDPSTYISLFRDYNMGNYFFNSLLYSFWGCFICLALTFPAAYALSRMRWKASRLAQAYLMSGLMIPIHAIVIPLYILVSKTSIPNRVALTFIYAVTSLPTALFLFIGHMKSIPVAIEEAAVMDGFTLPRVLLRIIMPLSRGSIASVVIFSFLNIWNDMMLALIFLSNELEKTVQIGIMRFQGSYYTNYPLLLSAIAMAILPTMILFFCMSRQIISGVTVGAVKE